MSPTKVASKKSCELPETHVQYAALPWRIRESLEIMLVTSRDTRRWVIPKGWPMKGLKPSTTAAVEALEEAGVVGKVEKKKVGSYHYRKRLKNGAALLCRVDVFPLRVARQRETWREKHQRVTHWRPYADAAEQVAEQELKEMILAFGEARTKEAQSTRAAAFPATVAARPLIKKLKDWRAGPIAS
jgi:8-oxo-dGTP pyrophosphatase MutT (NUDIX family)